MMSRTHLTNLCLVMAPVFFPSHCMEDPGGGDTGDRDSDGLLDSQELQLGTNPDMYDTDQDGIGDGDEYAYWNSRNDGVRWNSDLENLSSGRGDGLINLIDPDSDDDGLGDGTEIHGWKITVDGEQRHVFSDPARFDTDRDSIPDAAEFTGWDLEHPDKLVHIKTNPSSADSDNDSLNDFQERKTGLNPVSSHSLNLVSDLEWSSVMEYLGTWATDPKPSILNPDYQLSSAEVLIIEKEYLDLGEPAQSVDEINANNNFGANETSIEEEKIGTFEKAVIEFAIYIPEELLSRPIELRVEFIGSDGTGDTIYGVSYGKLLDGAQQQVLSCLELGSSISWKIEDPQYLEEGLWWFRLHTSYDKVSDKEPRRLKMRVYDAESNEPSLRNILFFSDRTDSDFGLESRRAVAKYTYSVSGSSENRAYFRGETTTITGSSNTYIDNIVKSEPGYPSIDKRVEQPIGQKSYNGYSYQFPIGLIHPELPWMYDYSNYKRIIFEWHYPADTISRLVTHFDEAGDDWPRVAITYDVHNRTNEYDCWRDGLAIKPAVVRRGTSFRVVYTRSGGLPIEKPSVEIRNSADEDVTSLFDIASELGYESYEAYTGTSPATRENYIVGIPESIPVGVYRLFFIHPLSGVSYAAAFYIVFNPYLAPDITQTEIEAYAYDEDTNGLFFGGDDDQERDDNNLIYEGTVDVPDDPALLNHFRTWPMYQFEKITPSIETSPYEFAMRAIDGAEDEMEALMRLYRVINQRIHYAGGGGPYDLERLLNENDTFNWPRGTAEALTSDDVEEIALNGGMLGGVPYGNIAHLASPGRTKAINGQCGQAGYGLSGLARSIGIPARPLKMEVGLSWMLSFHIWTEAYISNPPLEDIKSPADYVDHWYALDATDYEFSASTTGIHSEESIDPRVDRYRVESIISTGSAPLLMWVPNTSWVLDAATFEENTFDMIDMYNRPDTHFNLPRGDTTAHLGVGDLDAYRIHVLTGTTVDFSVSSDEGNVRVYINFGGDYPNPFTGDYTWEIGEGETTALGVSFVPPFLIPGTYPKYMTYSIMVATDIPADTDAEYETWREEHGGGGNYNTYTISVD